MIETPASSFRPVTSRSILLGLGSGLAVGSLLHALAPHLGSGAGRAFHEQAVMGLLILFGDLFLKLLKLLIVPVILVSLAGGMASLTDLRRLGRIGLHTALLYLATTVAAILLALGSAVVVRPGDGLGLSITATGGVPMSGTDRVWWDFLLAMVPANPFTALAEGQAMQIILLALGGGAALAATGAAGARLAGLLRDSETVVVKLVEWIFRLAPLGVFALVARTFAQHGWEAVLPLLRYFLLVLAVLAIHLLVTYGLLLRLRAGLGLGGLLWRLREVLLVAFSTASSAATLPLTLRASRERLGVDPAVAGFTLPLGATVNMDGTAIMQAVATVFIAQAYGIILTPFDYLLIVATATLASIGTAAIPSAGLVTLTIVLEQVGLPLEAIGMILGVDRLLDMTRTVVNITGDLVITTVVAKREGAWDRAVWDAADRQGTGSPVAGATEKTKRPRP